MASVYTFSDLKNFFAEKNYKLLIVGDAEPVVHKEENGELKAISRPGGVSVALEPIAKAANGTFIARGRTDEDRKVVNGNGKITIKPDDANDYTLKRLFVASEETDPYYNGFANQT